MYSNNLGFIDTMSHRNELQLLRNLSGLKLVSHLAELRFFFEVMTDELYNQSHIPSILFN